MENEIYAVVDNDWNCEYGYDEYSLPIQIFRSKADAEAFAAEYRSNECNSDYSSTIVVPYILK